MRYLDFYFLVLKDIIFEKMIFPIVKVIIYYKSYLKCIRLQIFLSKMKKYLVENKNQISYFILKNFKLKKDYSNKNDHFSKVGHFREDANERLFYYGRSWTVILVRTVIDVHFSEDGHGRSFLIGRSF